MMEEGLGQVAETSAPVESASFNDASSEKSLPQSQVNELIGRAKHEAVEAYKRQHQQQESSKPQDTSSRPSGLNESEYRRIAAEESQRLRDQWISEAQRKAEQDSAQRIVQNFWDKVSSGKEKYDDFEQMTGNIEYSKFPNVVQLLADHIDNSDDVLYELGKDRFKLSQLEQLANMSPRDAVVQAKRLADSIKDNQAASKMRTPNAPLSQQRPSNTGTDAGGPLSMAQLKAKYKA